MSRFTGYAMVLWSLVVFAPVAQAAEAAATKAAPAVIVPFGSGDTVFETGPIPSDFLKKHKLEKQLEGWSAGYKCRFLSVFWAVIHLWKCEPVAFKGKQFFDESKFSGKQSDNWIKEMNQIIAKKYPKSAIKLSWWQQHGRWVLAGLLVLLIAVSIIRRNKRRR